MKTTIITTCALLLGCYAFAQEATAPKTPDSDYINVTEEDTTRLKFGQTKVLVINDKDSIAACDSTEKESNHHWAGFDFGVNGWLTPSNSTQLPAAYNYLELDYSKSIYMSFNFLEKDIDIVKDRMRLITGMGIDWNSYSFKQEVVLDPHSEAGLAGYIDSVQVYDKSKLRVTSLTVPLMIGFITNEQPDRSFRIAAGVIGRYVINTKFKQKYELDNVTYKPMVKDDFGVNPLNLMATVRVGYAGVNMYASYGLTNLFAKNNGPNVAPFQTGLSVTIN